MIRRPAASGFRWQSAAALMSCGCVGVGLRRCRPLTPQAPGRAPIRGLPACSGRSRASATTHARCRARRFTAPKRAVVHRRPGGRAEPLAPRCRPSPPSRSTIRSSSRSKIRSSGPTRGSTSSSRATCGCKDSEVPILREFLLRGGTLTFDDFHGPIEWANMEREMKRVFPDRKIVDLRRQPSDLQLLLSARRLSADAGPRLVPAGTHVGEGRLRRHAARDRGRQRPRHGADQLEHRHG